MKTKLLLIHLLPCLLPVMASGASEAEAYAIKPLVVHEWGTFTVLQDESGTPIPGVNINEESLPEFVFELSPGLAPDSHPLGPFFNPRLYQGHPLRAKGILRFDPAVTMRMETPIIYFHLPEGGEASRKVDVEVAFRHGWISEWYPNAEVVAPGFLPFKLQEPITSATTGRIVWKGLAVGGDATGLPATQEPVWLAPRRVDADPVRTQKGMREQYLFYRGVANLEALLRVTRSDDQSTLHITPNPSRQMAPAPMSFPHLWLADIRTDGTVAFRVLDGIVEDGAEAVRERSTPGQFARRDYSRDNLAALRASMRTALVADGLFVDEAEALLHTWEVSYFQSAGMRLFFLVPQAWTDAVLPMTLSEKARVERVMVGRIELVTPEQRERLTRMGSEESHSQQWFHQRFDAMTTAEQAQVRDDLLMGRRTLEDCGFDVPESYSDFLELGRFRDALVVNELRRTGRPGLQAFAKVYGLTYFHSW